MAKENKAAATQYKKMVETPIPRLISGLAVPTVISMMVTMIYNAADTYFVSKISVSASGATSVVFTLMGIIQACGFTFGHGAGSHISRQLGAKDFDEAKKYSSTAFFYSLFVGILITVFGLVFLTPFMKFIGSTDTILPYAKDYGRFILISAPAFVTSCVLNNILRYEGMAKLAMIGLTTGGILNMALDPIFIFAMNLGATGAGLATAISQYISMGILLAVFLMNRTQSKISIRYFSFEPRVLWDIVSTGVPSFARQSLNSVSTMVLNISAGVYGDACIAALGIVSKCSMFIFSIAVGIGQGFQPVCSFNYGAKKYKRVRDSIFFTLKLDAIVVAIFSAIMFAFAKYIVSFFRTETEIISVGTPALRYLCIALVLLPITMIANMTFQSIGKTGRAFFLACAQNGIFYIPLIVLFKYLMGVVGIELAQPVAYLIAAVVSLPFLLAFTRQLKGMKEETISVQDERHIAVIDKKPERSGKTSIPDGAINGNGDLGIILGNSENGMRIYISKCDIWYGVEKYDSGGIKPLGYIDIAIPSDVYNNYYVEQDMDNGEIRCKFESSEKCCKINMRVGKTENSIMIESEGDIEITPVLKVFEGKTDGEKGEFTGDGYSGIFRIFAGKECHYETHAYAAMKKLDKNTFYISTATNHDVENPKEFVLGKVSETDTDRYEKLKQEHYSAWKNFWSKSSFTLTDKELEQGWYASQYFLACSAGNPKFPPGIFANFITIENPAWRGDYHLNYNYQAPFYAACSSNHVEFTDGYHVPLEEFYDKGREFASKIGCKGILYPVGIAPKGLCTELNPDLKLWFERLFLGQKSNQIHPADIMVFRFKATRDKEYAKNHAYPYIKECLEFFEDYATLEKGRLFIKQDAAHEVPYYKENFNPKKYRRYINDTNNALTLGMLRLCLEAGIDMAKSLNIDEDKQEKWQNMLEHLSPFATYYRFFRKVYRYTEKGQMWNGNGDVGLQHIYPGGCVGLSSDEKSLKIARNTFKMKEKYCYIDDNAISSFFPMSARLGMDPQKTVSKLKELNKEKQMQNMLYKFEGGCLENCSIFANTINEMALQSHQGVIRLFPCWDKSINAKFSTLRADGAFLVSSQMENGEIGETEIISECGERLKLINPFEKSIVIKDGTEQIISEKIIELDTVEGEKILVKRA